MAINAKPRRLATDAARELVRPGKANVPVNSLSLLDRQARRIQDWVPISLVVARVVAELHYGSTARPQ